MTASFSVECEGVPATQEIGRRLGAALRCGDVVALVGPLGAGKTTLVKGIAAGAGVADLRKVNSPTFVIVNEYETAEVPEPMLLYHIDVYRLRGSDDLEAIGFDEMCRTGAVIIEWADRVADLLPDDRLTIQLEPLTDTRRRLEFIPAGTDTDRWSAALG